jgi:hypothetical protein
VVSGRHGTACRQRNDCAWNIAAGFLAGCKEIMGNSSAPAQSDYALLLHPSGSSTCPIRGVVRANPANSDRLTSTLPVRYPGAGMNIHIARQGKLLGVYDVEQVKDGFRSGSFESTIWRGTKVPRIGCLCRGCQDLRGYRRRR